MADHTVFLSEVEKLLQNDPRLSPVKAALIAAARFDIAGDSRTFSRLLDVPHALVLRELNELFDLGNYLQCSRRDNRTLRTYFAFSGKDD